MKVVYCSFDGRYSDNPRTLYERLRLTLPQTEHVWLSDPLHAHGFPADAVTVELGSPASILALETADVVVANTHIELDWVKRPDATYLQTWHGTPLKRVHRDVLWAPPGMLDWLDLDVARWDYLVSPNSVSTPRLRNAFGFSGEVLEVGYPRNDVLRSSAAERVRARVRKEFGVADGVTCVLYAPTWRDDEFYLTGAPPVQLALDVESFLADLGDGHALLSRLHPKVSDRSVLPELAGVTDVSSYPDAHELYLAADVLITDYSSVMFDFAVTGKPIVYYTYDLENYRDALRGFYFDLEPLAPGPMVRTQDELVDALRDLPGLTESFAERYAEFQATFCYLEDGHATERLAPLFWDALARAASAGSDSNDDQAAGVPIG